MIYLNADEDYYIRNKPTDGNDFYTKIKERAYQRKWTKEIHNLILLSPSEKNQEAVDSLITKNSEAYFLPYQHMVIRNISIKKINVFGGSIDEPDKETNNKIEKIGNKIHIKTRDHVIRKYILFKENQRLDPFYIAESERLLREQPFIQDVKIQIKPLTSSTDSIDVEILVKDNWSKGFDVTSSNLRNLDAEFWDYNLLGYGHELTNSYTYNAEKLPIWGLSGFYHVNNISSSFLNFKAGYSAYGNKGIMVGLWRDFFTQRTKYAGEIKYERFSRNYTIIKNDTTQLWEYFPVSYQRFDAWLGRSFPFRLKIFTTYPSFIVSAGIFRNSYNKRPAVSKDSRYDFYNKTFYLASLSLASKAYYKSSLIYNYGRTEDIPYGFIINLTHGIEQSEFKTRIYNSISLVKGNNLGQLGFLYNKIALGGFIHRDTFEQGILKLGLNYFSNLLVINRFKVRNFINIDFTKGYRRYNDEYLDINNFSGIRGLYNDSAIGDQRLRANFETVIFTPYYLLGFRVAFFAFLDFAYIGPSTQWIFKSNLYSGIGAGIRLRNERLVFKTFQIRLAYYPNISPRATGDVFAISQEWRFKPEDLTISSPQIIEFK